MHVTTALTRDVEKALAEITRLTQELDAARGMVGELVEVAKRADALMHAALMMSQGTRVTVHITRAKELQQLS